jgi:glycosyltransferase involved in cell wall biosynthesis
MRQQLFCNTSWAQVMFELTYALIKLGVPTIPQDEQSLLQKEFISREEELIKEGATEKYNAIRACLAREYEPDNAVTVHFTLNRTGSPYTRNAIFPNLSGHEALYITGNHTVTPDVVRRLAADFEKLLAPSNHVMTPYFQGGLSPYMGAVIPHGIDPLVYNPRASPLEYPTRKKFKFLQTSFPWVYEKGFDLTIQAFSRAFSSHDDACLVLRVPRIRNPAERGQTFGRLENLVRDARSTPNAPEILLVEMDVELGKRGGAYSAADCYVHPLRAEGFGMTILEAMACGLPVIATAWSGPSDFFSAQHGFTLCHSNPAAQTAKDGSVVRYHVEPSLDHLIYLMRHVYEHPEAAKALGQRAAEFVHRGWTWEHAALKMASTFSFL